MRVKEMCRGRAYRPRDRYGFTMTLVQVDIFDGPYDAKLGDCLGAVCFFEHERVYEALGVEAATAVLDHDETVDVDIEVEVEA